MTRAMLAIAALAAVVVALRRSRHPVSHDAFASVMTERVPTGRRKSVREPDEYPVTGMPTTLAQARTAFATATEHLNDDDLGVEVDRMVREDRAAVLRGNVARFLDMYSAEAPTSTN